MEPNQMRTRGFTAWTASGLVAGLSAAIVGGAFMVEGLLGYFYNTSIFWEGLDHVWEIYGGLAVVVAGAALGLYAILKR